MKHTLCLIKLSMFLLIMFVATGCPAPTPPDLTNSIRLIKLKDSTNKDYILAHYEPKGKYSTGEYAQVMRYNMCTSHPHHHYRNDWPFEFPESHHMPYWELPNNWLLIDWRYYDFPYNTTQAVILNQKWETLYQYDSWFFPKDMIRHKSPILDCVDINLSYLERSLEKTYSPEILQLVNQTKKDWEFYDIDGSVCICEVPERLDSIWSVIQEDLSDFIETGNDIEDLKVD